MYFGFLPTKSILFRNSCTFQPQLHPDFPNELFQILIIWRGYTLGSYEERKYIININIIQQMRKRILFATSFFCSSTWSISSSNMRQKWKKKRKEKRETSCRSETPNESTLRKMLISYRISDLWFITGFKWVLSDVTKSYGTYFSKFVN